MSNNVQSGTSHSRLHFRRHFRAGPFDGWNVPSCKTLKNSAKRIGFVLRFPIPKGAKTHVVRDDYTAFDLELGNPGARIHVGTGGNWARAGPRRERIEGAAEFTVRSYHTGKWNGFDVQGRSLTGEYWRYLGLGGESVQYRVESKDTVMALDQIINRACY